METILVSIECVNGKWKVNIDKTNAKCVTCQPKCKGNLTCHIHPGHSEGICKCMAGRKCSCSSVEIPNGKIVIVK